MPRQRHNLPQFPVSVLSRTSGRFHAGDPAQRHTIHVLRLLTEQRAREAARDHELDMTLRGLAQRNTLAAPPNLARAVQVSLSRVHMEGPMASSRVPSSRVPMLVLARDGDWAQIVVLTRAWIEHERRPALGGLSALLLALAVGLVSLARDPAILLTVLGTIGALFLSALATAHLVSSAVLAVMSTTVLATFVMAVYIGLSVVWVRLVRTPVEA